MDLPVRVAVDVRDEVAPCFGSYFAWPLVVGAAADGGDRLADDVSDTSTATGKAAAVAAGGRAVL